MTVPLIDDIERIGRAIGARRMNLDDGVRELMALSGGGFTDLGARDVLLRWKAARRRYAEANAPMGAFPAQEQ
jgi:hypothetical protein